MEFSEVVLLKFLLVLHFSVAVEIDFTYEVEAGKNECFHQFLKKDVNFEVEYQVIDGGDLDLNFVIHSPSGRVLIADDRKTENVHKVHASEEGDYAFCMDNSFSSFTEKLVFFELVTDEDENDISIDKDYQMDDSYEMKIEDFREKVGAIKHNLDSSVNSLQLLKSVEARDRYIAERNFERVNFWSSVQVFIMLSVGLVQVLMIRSLFDDKGKVARILKLGS